MNIHKFTFILLGALLLISLNLQAKEVKNFYINGIDNEPEDAAESAVKLQAAFTHKYGHILVNTEVTEIYNETQGTLDLVESGMQATKLDKFLEGLTGLQILTALKAAEISGKLSDNASQGVYMKLLEIDSLLVANIGSFEPSDPFAEIDVEDSIKYIENSTIIQPLTGPGSTSQGSENTLTEIRNVNQLARLVDLGMTAAELASLKTIAGASQIFQDLALAKKEYRENFGYYASQEYETQQKIRGKLDEVLNIGGAVNIVAHSQGNYFANEAVNNINQPDNTRLLSVGSPLGVIPETGAFVNLREDLVVRSFNYNLGWNYSNIPTKTWNLISDNFPLPTVLIANEYTLRAKNIEINNDKRGHNFITAYLKPNSDSREAIIDTMAKHYVEMGGDLLKPIGDIESQLRCEAFEKVYSVNSAINYDVEFYGDRCLFFAEDRVVDYNIENELVNQIYYAIDNLDTYVEYTTYRNFLNNLQLAKTDETWRNGYGVTLNSNGNVGCTVVDNCVDGSISTAQQCENLFEALTGLNNNYGYSEREGICYIRYNDSKQYIVYDSLTSVINTRSIDTDILSYPGRALTDLPDGINSSQYEINFYGLATSDYQVVLIVDGPENEVEYPISVTIGSGPIIPATTGRVEKHFINTFGEVMNVLIDFRIMYEDINNGVLINPEVRFFLVENGEI